MARRPRRRPRTYARGCGTPRAIDGSALAWAGQRRPGRRGAPVGQRDVLHRRPSRLRLWEEPHVVLDLVRHVDVDREPDPAERLDVERMVMCPLAAREDARELFRLLRAE